jgi:ATP-dependent DNA helicase RecG
VEGLNTFRSRYHKRMIFEEFLILEMILAMHRQGRSNDMRGISFEINKVSESRLIRNISFPLTAAQKRVIDEIRQDMGRPVQMSRLLQGDVGCGKTIVAAVAAEIALENGYQVAVMAPTEILAEQLYFHFHRSFDLLGKKTSLLTRLVKKQEKETLRKNIQQGEIDVVVGTQALIQKEVSFQKLGLVIIDEQHRFGVIQRAALMEKGKAPDVLVMTATPIPRSLSLTVYGDLDISVINEMPPGRMPVKTEVARGRLRQKVYRHIDKEVNKGHQAYIVYPLVEETEKSDMTAATEMSEKLSREIFPQWQVGLLHGRMHPEEKEKIMDSFKRGELQILVSTTVVEVGVDVTNATIMVIEHAERFGLAQLHQLRGRVGRGNHPSFCYLMTSGRMTEEAARRLSIMQKTTDGFKISEEDLAIRGPGEFLGKKQSGMPELILGNILRDVQILKAAREEAFSRVKNDPLIQDPGNLRIVSEIQKRYAEKSSLIRVG